MIDNFNKVLNRFYFFPPPIIIRKMTLKTRRLLFYGFAAIFLIGGTVLVLHSGGWLFDFKNLKFNRAGGIYIETPMEEVTVKIGNVELPVKSGFLKNSLLITNLSPKTYSVEIKKEDYQSWVKNLTVKPALVTQTCPVLLMPVEWTAKLIADNIEDFWIGPKYSAWKTKSGKLIVNNKSSVGDTFISWLYGGNSALIFSQQKKTYFVVNINRNNTTININLLFNNLKEKNNNFNSEQIVGISPHLFDGNKIIVQTAKKLYFLDFSKLSLETILLEKPSSLFLTENNELMFLKQSNLYLFDILSRKSGIIGENMNKRPDDVGFSPDGEKIAVLVDKKLFYADRSTTTLKEISSSAVYFKFSPDSEKIAFWEENGQIKVFFLKDQSEKCGKKNGDFSGLGFYSLDFKMPFLWHKDSAYLFIKFPENLYLLEIDERPPLNQQPINIKADKYYYSSDTNTLFFFRLNDLYKTAL